MARTKLIDLYKSFYDKPLGEQKTYGDLSPEEWEVEREKMGMKTDDEGNMFIDKTDSPATSIGKYDPGNEPLEIQHSETGLTYFINVEDIEAYVSGEEVIAVDPDRGEDAIRVTRDETDVVGVSEEELEDFMVSGDRSAGDVDDDDRFSGMDDMFGNDLEEQGPRPDYADVDGDGDEEESMKKAFQDKEKLDEYGCTEEEIEEGTCGYGKNGKIGKKPAGPYLMRERFQKLAGISNQEQEEETEQIEAPVESEMQLKPGRVKPTPKKDRLEMIDNLKYRSKTKNIAPYENVPISYRPGRRINLNKK
jgi:hypothetical protein